jgi:hypothetical protein
MITFTHKSRFAVVTAIMDGRYSLEEFSSEQDFRTCQPPLVTHSLRGRPNSTDILAALPDGYAYSGDEPLPDEPSIPDSISARQIRLWLVSHGVSLAMVDAAIDGIQDVMTRESVRVEWEYAPHVERTHAWLVQMAAALGLTEAQVDVAFREASTL